MMNRISLLLISLIFVVSGSFAQSYLISDGGTINACSGTVYDSGGANGDYSSNEDYSITICSNMPGASFELFFEDFDVESATWDNLTIYDGTNASAPVLAGPSGNSDLLGETIVSSGECMHLVWHSDGSVQHGGFAANISCLFPCQDFTIDLASPALPVYPDTAMYACPGIGANFEAHGVFPNNNQNYEQTDANLTWTWTVTLFEDVVYEGPGMNTLPYTFDEPGGNWVRLMATDMNGCSYVYPDTFLVYSAVRPTFDGTFADQTVICPGEEVNFEGFTQTDPWVVAIPETVADTFCASDDFIDVEQCAEFTHTAFAQGQTIESVDDIQAICMELEHSYVGDLDLYITCPNGQTMNLISYPNGCGGTYFGEPLDEYEHDAPDIDCGDPSTIGVLYQYCWTPGASSTIAENCSGNDVVPAGDYLPENGFESLVGCPVNGTWQICFVDNLSSDDGAVANFILQFSDAIMPSEDSLWQFQNTYADNDIIWSGDGMTNNNGGTAVAFPTTSGDQDFVFTVTDDFGCSYDTTVMVTVLSNGDPACCIQPDTYAGADDQVCSNSYNLSMTLSEPVNIVTWSQISGPGTTNFNGQQNSTNPTITVDTYGVYTYELYEENTGPSCSDRDTIEITFRLMPTPTFSTTFVNCYGESSTIQYLGNGDGGSTYNWDFDGAMGGGNGQGPYNLVWTEPGIHTVGLSVANDYCVSPDTSITVLVPEELTHVLTYEDDPCNGSCQGYAEVNVQGGSLPYTYSWGASNVNANICAGNYGLTVTDNNGCEVSENYVINEPAPIVITGVTTQDIDCFNADNGSIVINAGGGFGNLTYSWSDGGMGANRQNLPAGNYVLTIEDEHGCSITDQYTLVQPTELLVSISPDQAHCEGTTSSITAQAIGGTEPYTYYWNSGNGFFPNANELMVAPDETTNYIVYVEDDNGCTTSPADMTMIISPQMYMTLTTKDNRCYHSCDGEALLQIEGGIPPLNYSWSAEGAMNNDLCAGMYEVTVTDILGCNVDTAFYISEPSQMFANAYTEDATCSGYDDGLAWVEVVGGVPGYTYLWPDGSTNDSIVLGAGRYTMTISDSHDCRLEIEPVVQEPTAIQAQLVGGDRHICKTNSTMLNSQAIGGTPYYDFYWTGTDGTSYVIHNPDVSPDTTTVYTLTVVDSHGCSSNMPSVTVNVFPDLEIQSVTTSYDSICPGDPAIIEVDATGGNGGPYVLTLHDGQVVPSPFTIYPEETTNYIITLSDACGTPVVQDSVEITVMPSPDNAFVSDKVEGCPPFNVRFNEMSEDVGQTYLWNFGDDGFAFDKNPGHIYHTSGQFPVSLTVTSPFGCETTRTIENMIFVYDKPLADFYTDESYVSILDPEVQFFNVSEMMDSSYWFFGDGDSSHFVNPSHSFADVGEFEVRLIVESRSGCLDTITKFINVKDEFTFWAPTAFSPNGDGDNDFFMVYGNGIDSNEFELLIYDRWGELVYQSDIYDPSRPIESAWDGTFDGNRSKGDRLLHNGVYYWYCKFKDYTGVWHEKEGTVTLLR